MLNMTDFATSPRHGECLVMASDLPSQDRNRGKEKRPPQDVRTWNVTKLPHAVLVGWSEIKDSSPQSARAGFDQVIALCEATRKDEFVVEDIAPDYRIGYGKPEIVIKAQERIVSIFMQVASTRFRQLPEHRLSLRGATFDLRFYLRRNRPTDSQGPVEDY